MVNKKRRFISIYFNDGLVNQRIKRDVNISFRDDDDLYQKCRTLGSTNIKNLIGIESYTALVNEAKIEERSLSNYIKSKLRILLNNE